MSCGHSILRAQSVNNHGLRYLSFAMLNIKENAFKYYTYKIWMVSLRCIRHNDRWIHVNITRMIHSNTVCRMRLNSKIVFGHFLYRAERWIPFSARYRSPSIDLKTHVPSGSLFHISMLDFRKTQHVTRENFNYHPSSSFHMASNYILMIRPKKKNRNLHDGEPRFASAKQFECFRQKTTIKW